MQNLLTKTINNNGGLLSLVVIMTTIRSSFINYCFRQQCGVACCNIANFTVSTSESWAASQYCAGLTSAHYDVGLMDLLQCAKYWDFLQLKLV